MFVTSRIFSVFILFQKESRKGGIGAVLRQPLQKEQADRSSIASTNR